MKLRGRARKRIGRLKTIDAHTGKQPRRTKHRPRFNNEKRNRTRQTGVFYRLGGPGRRYNNSRTVSSSKGKTLRDPGLHPRYGHTTLIFGAPR
jgi:hypothetical protein